MAHRPQTFDPLVRFSADSSKIAPTKLKKQHYYLFYYDFWIIFLFPRPPTPKKSLEAGMSTKRSNVCGLTEY